MGKELAHSEETRFVNGDTCQLLDLAESLLPQVEAKLSLLLPEQIAAWQTFYEQREPGLLRRMFDDYKQVEGGWRGVAERRIFPKLAELLPAMKRGLLNLHGVCGELCRLATTKLGLAETPVVVAYVGLGNGAGWATTWHGRPAVLVGLESVAELGWEEPRSLRGLLAHEIGHLLMKQIRGDDSILMEDPFLALYEEGFAQHCEHVVLGDETWHCSSQKGWIEWCRAHDNELARLYLAASDDAKERRRFFGSWYEFEGWRQTGYYLGCRCVQRQGRNHALAELAGWSNEQIRRSVRDFLTGLGRQKAEAQ